MRPHSGHPVAIGAIGAAVAALAGCIDARTYRDAVDGGPTPDAPALAGHDEDTDGVDDALDNCPDRYNPTQDDTSESALGLAPDGVGDACDPSKDQNRILLFDGFDRPLAGRWQMVGDVGWAAAGDQAVVARAPATLSSIVSTATLEGRVLVVARLEVLGATTGLAIELSPSWDPVAASGPACELTVPLGNAGSELRIVEIVAGQPTRPPPVAAPPVAAEGTFPLSAGDLQPAGARRCTVGDVVATGTGPARAAGQIRIGVARTVLAISSIVVYALP